MPKAPAYVTKREFNLSIKLLKAEIKKMLSSVKMKGKEKEKEAKEDKMKVKKKK